MLRCGSTSEVILGELCYSLTLELYANREEYEKGTAEGNNRHRIPSVKLVTAVQHSINSTWK